MQFTILTLFPEMFRALDTGITGRALKKALIQINCINPRDFTIDKHRTVDDRPFGGGPGMLMKVEPLSKAIQAARVQSAGDAKVIYLSPQGRLFNQAAAQQFAKQQSLIFIAGRYEGIDERIIEAEVDEEWSVGDFIVTGGEIPAMLMIDAITRLLPNALGDEASAAEDSLTDGLLKYPQYTRPNTWHGKSVPKILSSGHHADICRWRLKQSLGRTWLKRPDLLAKKQLSNLEKILLSEFIAELHKNK